MKLGRQIDYQLPHTPNYILHESKIGLRQDGFKEADKTDIAEFTDEQLREIGAAWTERLVLRARERRREAEQLARLGGAR